MLTKEEKSELDMDRLLPTSAIGTSFMRDPDSIVAKQVQEEQKTYSA